MLTDFMSFEPEAGLYIVDAYHDIKDRLAEHNYQFVYEVSGDCLCFDYRERKKCCVSLTSQAIRLLMVVGETFPHCRRKASL